MTIALIEDDEAILRSLSMLLESRGIPVKPYASAESFLAESAVPPTQCIVSDIRMPGISGMELQQELKKRGSAVPVILITGHGDIATAVQAIKQGAFDFIEKPLSPRQVEVMRLVANGCSNKEIAHKLNLSRRTVENYRAWMMEKMAAKNLADLVRKAIALGFE
jgi:two-component system response regulator FixJ